MTDVLITNGMLINPDSGSEQQADLFLRAGSILAIGSAPDGFTPDRSIDAEGCWVLPGLIDAMAHLPEPGHEHRGSMASELGAAVAGGVTDLLVTPDTDPALDNAALARLLQERAEALNLARIHIIAAMTSGLEGKQLTEMYALQNAGCIGVSNLAHPFADNRTLLRCMEYAVSSAIRVFLLPCDAALAGDGCAHGGAVATRLGLRGIPTCAETVALSRDLQLVEQTGVQAHVLQLSSARSVELVAEAQARGLPVTAGVSIHHLLLNEEAVDGFNSQCHLQPPLRSEEDRLALLQGLRDGVISCICSGHKPHEPAAKHAPFAASAAGASAVELLASLTVGLVKSGELELATAIRALTSGPGKLIDRGIRSLQAGEIADLCIIDPEDSWVLDAGSMLSAGTNSPFLGESLSGKVRCTLLGGIPVQQ